MNGILRKQGLEVIQNATMTFPDQPGVKAHFKLKSNNVAMKNSTLTCLEFSYNKHRAGVIPVGLDLTEVDFSDPLTYQVRFLHSNPVASTITELKMFKDFDRVVTYESETVYRKLDGTIIPLKVKLNFMHIYAEVINNKEAYTKFAEFLKTSKINGFVSITDIVVEPLGHWNQVDDLDYTQYDMKLSVKLTPEKYEQNLRFHRPNMFFCGDKIRKELGEAFLNKYPQYRLKLN